MNKKDHLNSHFIQLEAYSQPKIIESNRDKWVEFGENNNFFQFLIDRYNGSTTNNAVINNIVKLIYGRGLDATDSFTNVFLLEKDSDKVAYTNLTSLIVLARSKVSITLTFCDSFKV